MSKGGFKKSRFSAKDYFEWRVKRGVPAVERVENFFSLLNKKVLDIGCGNGALMKVLIEKGARVSGIEHDAKKIVYTKEFLKDYYFDVQKVDSEILPFDKNIFDAIFLFDVIEHVKHPKKTIEECTRVLKPNGVLYVEFTPYYSITGHHLYDFSKLPIHIFPKSVVKKIVYGKKISGFMDHDYFWNQFESLNKLRISQFQKMTSDYEKIFERFIIKYPEVFEINLPFINAFGPLKDFFTLSFEGFYRKV